MQTAILPSDTLDLALQDNQAVAAVMVIGIICSIVLSVMSWRFRNRASQAQPLLTQVNALSAQSHQEPQKLRQLSQLNRQRSQQVHDLEQQARASTPEVAAQLRRQENQLFDTINQSQVQSAQINQHIEQLLKQEQALNKQIYRIQHPGEDNESAHPTVVVITHEQEQPNGGGEPASARNNP